MLSNVREQWFSNIRGDVLAGLVVGLAHAAGKSSFLRISCPFEESVSLCTERDWELTG